jgi:hypothetical protein
MAPKPLGNHPSLMPTCLDSIFHQDSVHANEMFRELTLLGPFGTRKTIAAAQATKSLIELVLYLVSSSFLCLKAAWGDLHASHAAPKILPGHGIGLICLHIDRHEK